INITTSGSGEASFYLIGPVSANKTKVQAGSNIPVDSDQLEHAGRYVAILCASDGCTAANFFVNPAEANRLSFLVHPSRIPVGTPDGISAVAIVHDGFRNIVLQPSSVTFSIMAQNAQPVS